MQFLDDIPEKPWQHWEDLPPEKEKELIEKLARYTVRHKMGLIAEMMLESGGSLTSVFATLGMGMFGPFLEFFGADTYAALLRKRENVQHLFERIEELEDEERAKSKKPKQEADSEPF